MEYEYENSTQKRFMTIIMARYIEMRILMADRPDIMLHYEVYLAIRMYIMIIVTLIFHHKVDIF